MSHKRVIGILGDGRIARAVASFFQARGSARVVFAGVDSDAARCDLLVGALPGELGERGLRLALRYKKDLVDISDVDPPFYLRHKKAIALSGITVIPGCGFSPGLVNCILGYELATLGSARRIEIKAGSLSRKSFYFPFLWCFEDLALEHSIPSWQLIGGAKKKFPPFAGRQKERFFGIEAESYYCASGFENILDKFGARTIITRVVRPAGFREFFGFMTNYAFFSPERICQSKALLEAAREDNTTMAHILFASGRRRVEWEMKSSSLRDEKLNSMQKITASVPAAVARLVMDGALPRKGLLFMEDLGGQQGFLGYLLAAIGKDGVKVRRVSRAQGTR